MVELSQLYKQYFDIDENRSFNSLIYGAHSATDNNHIRYYYRNEKGTMKYTYLQVPPTMGSICLDITLKLVKISTFKFSFANLDADKNITMHLIVDVAIAQFSTCFFKSSSNADRNE